MAGPRSRELFQQAKELMPGGVNSPVRAFGTVGGTPVFVARGEGSHIWDVDGNEYIDYVGSWGPLILGHAHPKVQQAVIDAVHQGTTFGAPTEPEIELARIITAAFPSIEMVRMVNSGTEATMSAIRLARGYTRRDKIVKFAGCWHGHVDGLLVKAGSSGWQYGTPDSAGVPESYTRDTLIARYNDLASVRRLFDQWGKQIAGLIVEPVAGNMGVIAPQPGFLEGLRRLTEEYEALLIFDEVITGFRVAFGGAQQRYGLKADLTTLGKIIGGGFPVGAYGGRADIMQCVLPLGEVVQAGTLSGNPVAMTAGIATLSELKRLNPYPMLEQKASALADGLAQVASEVGVETTCNRVGSILTKFFAPGPIRSADDIAQISRERYAAYFHAMLQAGVALAPSHLEAAFVSAVHSDADIARTLEASRAAFHKAAEV